MTNPGTTLVQDLSSSATSIVVASAADFVDPKAFGPYSLWIQKPTADPREVVRVTAVDYRAGILTVVRGVAGQQQVWPAGTNIGTQSSSGWDRPLSALKAGGNGLDHDDPAASGAVTRRVWDPTLSSQHYNWRTGYYGHPTHQAQYPTGIGQSANVWDGQEFYLQFRIKIDGTRWLPPNLGGGKLFFVHCLSNSMCQQLVGRMDPISARVTSQSGRGSHFDMFTNRGVGPTDLDGNLMQGVITDPQGGLDNIGSMQPGSKWASTCTAAGWNKVCWLWPADRWVTILLYLRPGLHHPGPYNVNGWMSDPKYKNTVVKAWIAEDGDGDYTPVYSKSDLVWIYGDGLGNYGEFNQNPPGFNAFSPTAYQNVVDGQPPPGVTYSYRFAQVILSREWIPCPKA
jgi:hypothetical protein